MTKFNKSLLTAAVVGALALPGLASAASLNYTTAAPGVQNTYAWELFVDNGITIKTPGGLALVAQEFDNANLGTVTAGEVLRVKVTLTNGAKFDTGIAAATFAGTFTEGSQTGGANAALANVAAANYSLSGHELNFTYTATGAGVPAQTTPAAITAGAYLLGISTVQLNSLVQGLRDGSQVGMEITIQDNTNVQIFAASSVIVKSVHGVTVTSSTAAGDQDKTIDVASLPVRKAQFSNTGSVGGYATSGAGAGFFNAGTVTVDITKALRTLENGNATAYVNNYDPTVAPGVYNVVNTAEIKIGVKGTQLNAFGANRAFLATVGAGGCTAPAADRLFGSVNAAGDTITFTSAASAARWQPLTAAVPAAVTHAVCLLAGGGSLTPQALSGTFDIDYKLPTQRNNLPTKTFNLLPLRENGTTVIFQNVNPASNATAQSFLRLTNNNAYNCPVIIDAKDDAGRHTGEVKADLVAHGSLQINSDDLEKGNTGKGLTGSWGDGTGRWYVRVVGECANLAASALNRNSTNGTVTDLTPAKNETWLTPTTKLTATP